MYKLHPATFYRRNGDNVVCYQTKAHKVFTFNSIVGDILDAIKDGADIEQIVSRLSAIYQIKPDERDKIKSISDFVSMLENLSIVVSTNLKDYFGSLENQIVSDAEAGVLNTVMFELTYRCSEKCRHCYVVQSDEGEMTTDEIKKALDDLAAMNTTYVVFTGGEPFLRNDFIEILRYAYKLGFVVSIFTNGINITDEQFYEVAECYPRCINFSLYSSGSEIHDSITQVKGSYNRTLRAMKRFLALGISVNIKTLIMRENCDDIENLVKVAEELGATIQVGASIAPRNDRDKAPLKMRVTDEEILENAIRKSYDRIQMIEGLIGGKRNIDACICGAGQNNLSINPQGIVYPCNALMLPVGNLRESSVSEIWNNSAELRKWRENKFSDVADCKDCDKKDSCGFCPGTALNETGSPYKKYEEACRVAAIHKKISSNYTS